MQKLMIILHIYIYYINEIRMSINAWSKPLIKNEPLEGPNYVSILSKDIWNIIFKFSDEESRVNISISCHYFYDIIQNYTFPPWQDPDMSLVEAGIIDECNALDIACKKGETLFFVKWNKIANGRWNPVRTKLKNNKLYSPALENACMNKHYDILKELIKDNRLEPVIDNMICKMIDWTDLSSVEILLTFETLDQDKILHQLTNRREVDLKMFILIYNRFYPDMSLDEIKQIYDFSYEKRDENYIDYDNYDHFYNQCDEHYPDDFIDYQYSFEEKINKLNI